MPRTSKKLAKSVAGLLGKPSTPKKFRPGLGMALAARKKEVCPSGGKPKVAPRQRVKATKKAA